MLTYFRVLLCLTAFAASIPGQPASGPLRVNARNGRYFADANGRAVLLAGSHTWASLQDILSDTEGPFDYGAYLDMMQKNRHNFMRLWFWEQTRYASWTDDPIRFGPMPWSRTGPGMAADGEPKFDLTRFDPKFFARLRERTAEAGRRGIYVSIMLFQGFSLHKGRGPGGDPWPYQAFNPANNIQKIGPLSAKQDSDTEPTLHSMKNAGVVALQEAYVRKVIDTVNNLDNVLYEIINEGGALDWQAHMVDFIHQYERGKPKQHPVGMTHRISPGHQNRVLWDSEAEWISPGQEQQEGPEQGSKLLDDYRNDPPVGSGAKVVVSDTDHLWGHGVDHRWVWKSLVRGLNLLLMDTWRPIPGKLTKETADWMMVAGGIDKNDPDFPGYALTRVSLGAAQHYAGLMDLNRAIPHPELASNRWCLAVPGESYLVYIPDGGSVTVDLRGAAGRFDLEWYLPLMNKTLKGRVPMDGGAERSIAAPAAYDAVLYLRRAKD